MHVEPAPSVHVEDRLAEQAHVARAHQRVDPPILQERQHGQIEVRSIGEAVRLDHGALDARVARARPSERTPGRSDRTSAMCGRTTGSSRSACRFVPEPDTSTAMRASIGRTLPRGPNAQDRGVSFDDADGRAHDERDGAMRDASVTAHGRHVRRVRPTALRRVRGPRHAAGCWDRSAFRRSSATTSPRRPPRVPGDGSRVARRPHGRRVARRRRARDAVPVDEVQHRLGVRGSVGVRGALVDAHRLRRGDRPRPLVRVRSPAAGGADRRRSSPGRSSPWAPCSPRSTRRRSPSRRSPRGSRSPPAPSRPSSGRVRELQVSRPTCLTRPWAGALIEQVTGRSMRPGSCVLEGRQDGEVRRLRYGEDHRRPARSSWSRGSCCWWTASSHGRRSASIRASSATSAAKANAWGGSGGWAGVIMGILSDRPADLGRHPIGEHADEPLHRRHTVEGHRISRIRGRRLRVAEVHLRDHERAVSLGPGSDSILLLAIGYGSWMKFQEPEDGCGAHRRPAAPTAASPPDPAHHVVPEPGRRRRPGSGRSRLPPGVALWPPEGG